jgi:hypothetical protein
MTIHFTGRKKNKGVFFFLRPVKQMVVLVTSPRDRSLVSIKACRFIYCRSAYPPTCMAVISPVHAALTSYAFCK